MKKIIRGKGSERLLKRGCALLLSAAMMFPAYNYVEQKTVITAQAASAFETELASFPASYRSYITALHKKYPNWHFEAKKIDVDFNTVVANEMNAVTTSSSGNKSLVAINADDLLKRNLSVDYNVSTGNYYYKDSSSWVTAGKNTVGWFLDPRNWLNEVDIMQFEKTSFDSTQTLEGVENIFASTGLDGKTTQYYSYTYDTKTKKWTKKLVKSSTTYAKQFYNSGKAANISPLYLASKCVQEIGGSLSNSSVSGDYTSNDGKHHFYGLFNFFNIGANDSSDPVVNGLTYANGGQAGVSTFMPDSKGLIGGKDARTISGYNNSYNRRWTTPAKAITGGAQFFYDNYVSQGQDTGYFVRFNVAPTNSWNMYWHQFMTCISGACQENSATYSAYQEMGVLANSKKFLIPVYNNMPNEANTISINDASSTGVAQGDYNVRSGAGIGYSALTYVPQGTKVTVLAGQRATGNYSYNNQRYPYWYKIQFTQNGKTVTGYVTYDAIAMNSSGVLTNGDVIKTTRKDTSDPVYYYSDNPAIATVDGDTGVVSVKKVGTVTIYTFLQNGKMDAATYNTGSLKMNTSSKTIAVGSKYTLKAVAVGCSTDITWKSSNTKIATVSKTGVTVGKSIGTATITATSKSGISTSCVVTIKPKATTIKLTGYYDKVKIDWTRDSAATGYVLYRSNPGTNVYKRLAVIKNNKTVSYTDKNVILGKTYNYCIRVYKTVSGKNIYSSVTPRPGVRIAPAPSKITSVKILSKTSLKVGFKKVSGATKYYLYIKKQGDKSYKRVSVSSKTLSYTFKGLKNNNTYYVCIKSYRNANGYQAVGDVSKIKIKMS